MRRQASGVGGRKNGETLWTGPNRWVSAAGSGDQRTARSYLGTRIGRKGGGIAAELVVVELIHHLGIVTGVGRFRNRRTAVIGRGTRCERRCRQIGDHRERIQLHIDMNDLLWVCRVRAARGGARGGRC